MKVGVLVPARTPASFLNAMTGDDALRGASVAENALSLRSNEQGDFLVLIAHTPTVETVERAAARLIVVDEVDALVGGYEPFEAEVVARVATNYGVPFFNVGSEDDALRDVSCYPTTFHVAPSTAMMLAATLRAAAEAGAVSVYAIVEVGSDVVLRELANLIEAGGQELIGTALVESGQFVYYPVINDAAASGADLVLLIMSAEAQELLLSQASTLSPQARIAGLTGVRGQSRPYLQRFAQVRPELAIYPRVLAWDPSLESDLNAAFAARTGEPMEAAAWTTYAAIMTTYYAAAAGQLGTAYELRSFLTDPNVALNVGKGTAVSFRSDGQMLQDLYLIQPHPDAPWGRTAAVRTELASVLEVIHASATAGAGANQASACPTP